MKRDAKRFLLFLLFLGYGVYGAYSVNFIQSNKVLSNAFRWFTVPSVIIAAYYAYRFVDTKAVAYKKISGRIVLTLLFTLMLLKSFQRYLILFNCHVGKQTTILVKGQVMKLNFPVPKKPLNHYKIDIQLDGFPEMIELDVPTNKYALGQIFEKEMTIGSLGYLYHY